MTRKNPLEYGSETGKYHQLVFSNRDTSEFAKRWPGSVVGGERLVVEFDPRGDLVDLRLGNAGRQDVPDNELAALLESFGWDPHGRPLKKNPCKNPSWPYKPGSREFHDHVDALELLSKHHEIDYGSTRNYIITGKVRIDGKLMAPKQVLELAIAEGFRSMYSGVPKRRHSIGDDPEFLARETGEQFEREKNPRRSSGSKVREWEQSSEGVEFREIALPVFRDISKLIRWGSLRPAMARVWVANVLSNKWGFPDLYRRLLEVRDKGIRVHSFRQFARESRNRGLRQNPRPRRVPSRTVAKAAKLRKDFSGRSATRAQFVEIPDPPDASVLLGELIQVNYRANKKGDGKAGEYYHRFHRPYPRIVSDPDGKRLYISGGKFKITTRGIER